MNLAIVAEEYLNDADEARFFEVRGVVRELCPDAVWFPVRAREKPRTFWRSWRMAIEAENIDLRGFDAVISLGHGFAHGAITQLKTRHISYLLSPPSLWSDPGRAGHWYRIWSLARSAQVERWIAGTEAAADHLKKAWRVKEVSQAYSTPDFKKCIEEIIINHEIPNPKLV